MDIQKLIYKNYYSYSLSISRCFLAVCTLLTLCFNTSTELGIELPQNNNFSLNIFYIFNDVTISYTVCFIILLLVIIGIYPAIMGILHFWVACSFLFSSKLVEGGDQIVHIMTLILTPILILDNRKNHWKLRKKSNNFYKNTICYFCDILIKIQFFVIYFFASVSKFSVTEWQNGTAIYYWLSDPVFGLNESLGFFILPLLKNPYIVTLTTWLVLVLELFIAFSVFISSKKYKQTAFVIGVFFHFFIGVFFGLWSFYFAMLGILSYILLNSFNSTKWFKNFQFK